MHSRSSLAFVSLLGAISIALGCASDAPPGSLGRNPRQAPDLGLEIEIRPPHTRHLFPPLARHRQELDQRPKGIAQLTARLPDRHKLAIR